VGVPVRTRSIIADASGEPIMGPPSPRAPQGRALERYGTVLIPRLLS
jgi:hypothetical protein